MKRILTLPLITAFVAAPIQTATAATLVSNSAQDPSTMSEEEKSALAKTYYVEAESAFKAGDYLTAVTKYEEAYFLVPGKHGFAYKVGTAAWKLGDCVKADEYFRHYVTYETRESKADKIEEALPFPLSPKELDINGREMMELGFRGQQIGNAFRKVLAAIHNRQLDNTYNDIVGFVGQ